MSLIPGSYSSIPSIHIFPRFFPTVPFNAWQVSGSRQGRDSFQEASKIKHIFFGGVERHCHPHSGQENQSWFFQLRDKHTAKCCKAKAPTDSSCGAQISFIVNLSTGHQLKEREFEEDKLRHLLFHFGLLERM